jgi:hypothetical protein
VTARLSIVLLLLAALPLAAAGCDPGAESPAPSRSATSASPAAPASAGKRHNYGDQYADEDVAVPSDYEQEAEKAITKANYKDELRAIQAELGVPPANASASATPATPAPAPAPAPAPVP